MCALSYRRFAQRGSDCDHIGIVGVLLVAPANNGDVNVQLKTIESLKPESKLASIAAAIVYLACCAAIVGWSLPGKIASVFPVELKMPVPETRAPESTDARSTPVHAMGKTRNKVNCAECGVIESMRRIDKREEILGWCGIGDTPGAPFHGDLIDGGGRFDSVTLADTVADIVAGDHGARKARVTTQHQIVVRFRDGSKRVFNEETPRTVHVGDRIQVIAGATGPNG